MNSDFTNFSAAMKINFTIVRINCKNQGIFFGNLHHQKVVAIANFIIATGIAAFNTILPAVAFEISLGLTSIKDSVLIEV